MNAPGLSGGSRWASAWPDAVAFGGGLAVAWVAGWNTTDLVWSLWLSSLVVGYAMLVWRITAPLRALGGNLARERGPVPAGPALGTAGVVGCGALFVLAFFTVHFGGFHLGHSVFLSVFFPLDGSAQGAWPSLATYLEVVARYWWFLPVAFVAERAAFRIEPPGPADTAVTAQAIAARKAKRAADPMMAPYKNVIRMHLLIFFFAFASFVKLENFAVYAVVYAVYFFPWRLVRRTKEG